MILLLLFPHRSIHYWSFGMPRTRLWYRCKGRFVQPCKGLIFWLDAVFLILRSMKSKVTIMWHRIDKIAILRLFWVRLLRKIIWEKNSIIRPCCTIRLVQIMNKAAPSELIPREYLSGILHDCRVFIKFGNPSSKLHRRQYVFTH